MKKLLLTLIACTLTLGLWAADVTVTEKFALQTANIKGTPIQRYHADLCKWDVYANRRTTDVIKVGENDMRCWWLTYTDENTYGYVKSVNFEGGIKKVDFRCAQFGAADTETNNTLKLSFSVGSESHVYTVTGSPTKTNGGETSSFTFAPNNGQLVINNASVKGGTDACRILLGDLVITPYLLYQPHNKYITLGLGQKGFANYLINNTGSNNITYESSNTTIATVDGNGVITPKAVGTTTITASWESCSTTYSLTIINETIVENFSQIGRVNGSISEDPASWSGDLSSWTVRYVRRGVGDSVAGSFAPRKQATWLTRPATTKTGYIETTAVLEGGIKHVKIPWQQWATESGKLKLALYTTKEIQNPTWNERKSQDVAAASKGTNFTFDEDIDADGSLGNVRVKISNESYNGENPTTARLILENIQITPWLLYTTKEATLDVRGENALTYTNPDLIDNTTGDDPVFSISENASSINVSIDPATGTVTAADRYQTGDITVQAKWSEVTTTYTLHVIGKADANAHFVNDEENKTLLDLAFNNPVVKAAGSANAVYSSEFDTVATVDPASGTVTIVAPGTTTITATIEENDNFQGAVVSYTLHIAAPNFYVVGSAVDSWDPNHVPVYADSYTIKNLAAGTPYMLKITRNGTWVGDDNVYGYDALTKSEMVVGITRGSGTDNDNICFTLAEAGDVTVTYTGEVFKVFGVFDPQTTIKVVGDDAVIGAWKYDDGITLVPTDDRKALSATVELTKGYYEFKVVLNNGNDWMGKNGNDGLFHLHRTYNSVSDLVKDQGNFKLTPDVAGDYTFTWAYGTGTLTVTYPDLPAPVYYLAGSMFGEGEWSETKQLMTEIDGVWSKTVSFESTDYKEFKIVRSVEGIYVISQDWLGLAEYQNITATTSDLVIGTGESNIGITPSKAGDYGFTFDPDGNKLSVTFPTATAIDETDVNVKAVKKVVDGQLIIEKKGVRYNVIGQVL